MNADITNDIPHLLKIFTDDLTNLINEECESNATESAEKLNATSPTRTGKYAKDWTVKKTKDGFIVHNKNRYRVTHLLEYGHAKRGGGRVVPKIHIKPIEEKAIKQIEMKVDDFLGG